MNVTKAHCRICWQFLPTLGTRCPHCGDHNSLRLCNTVGGWLIYSAGAAAAALGFWMLI